MRKFKILPRIFYTIPARTRPGCDLGGNTCSEAVSENMPLKACHSVSFFGAVLLRR